MTSLQIYDYTEGELGSLLAQQSFSYSVEHPDRLTIFNGTSISYNSIGCPTTFNRYNTTWSRGKLTGLTKGKMTTGTYSYSYTYNALGQRTQRSFNYFRGTQNSQVVIGETKSEVRTYTYDQSGRLIEEGISNEYYNEPGTSETLVYLYDERGIVGVNHTSSGETNTYYYQRNLFGDVIGIYDVNGNCVARYVYDAWGNCSMTHSTKSIATRNPFRYRGYYYDQDTGLYYLNSRYYYPEWRRFISPDDTSYLDPEIPNGLNLYTYCNNDPVNYCDPSGHFAISLTVLGLIAGSIIGGAIGGIAAYNTAKDNGVTGWDLFGWTMVGVLGGGIVGGVAGAGIGALVTKATGVLGYSIIKGNIFTVTKTMVIGHYGYASVATSLGYGFYQISSELYNSMNDIQRWEMNSQFLDDCAKLGANFLVEATRVISPIYNGMISYLYYEIEYLLQKGYVWLEDLSGLVKP